MPVHSMQISAPKAHMRLSSNEQLCATRHPLKVSALEKNLLFPWPSLMLDTQPEGLLRKTDHGLYMQHSKQHFACFG